MIYVLHSTNFRFLVTKSAATKLINLHLILKIFLSYHCFHLQTLNSLVIKFLYYMIQELSLTSKTNLDVIWFWNQNYKVVQSDPYLLNAFKFTNLTWMHQNLIHWKLGVSNRHQFHFLLQYCLFMKKLKKI